MHGRLINENVSGFVEVMTSPVFWAGTSTHTEAKGLIQGDRVKCYSSFVLIASVISIK
jgi:hypothetical protein